jgi:predicted nucleic acid-binding protein
VLIDTDVLIWAMKGNSKAVKILDSLEVAVMSAVNYMELLQGARTKAEIKTIKARLKDWGIGIKQLNPTISEVATNLVEKHFHSHSLNVTDALIAATAMYYKFPVITANDKHFKSVEDLEIKVFRP